MTATRKPKEEMTIEEQEIWARFDSEIQLGLDAAKAGRFVDADRFFDQLKTKYRAMNKRRG